VKKLKELLIWLKHNERHLWTVMFFGGFTCDIIAFFPAPLSQANFLFLIYLSLVLIGTLGAHYCYVNGYDKKKGIVARIMNVGFQFVADFFCGGLLSGLLIFYTKNSSILASWPFILFLLAVFAGNERFRDYRKHLAFQLTLVFFTIYAYAIFSLPLLVGTIGPWIFLASGAISCCVYGALLGIMAWIGWKRLWESDLGIILGAVGLIVIVNLSYFTGVIPPLPLTLTEASAYQTVAHSGGSYVLTGEPANPWWDVLGTRVIHITPSDASVSIFSSVYAPVKFSSTVVHRWEYYDAINHKWVQRAEIAFSLSGGRDGGYRGYSTLTNVSPGKYRVSIETLSGQIIGRVEFTVVDVSQEPALITTVK
jgi:hypothetical protein